MIIKYIKYLWFAVTTPYLIQEETASTWTHVKAPPWYKRSYLSYSGYIERQMWIATARVKKQSQYNERQTHINITTK